MPPMRPEVGTPVTTHDDSPNALDPDEVVCPKCHALPNEVCRKPSGERAPSIHLARRRAAAAGQVTPADPAPPPQRPRRTKPEGSATFDSATASAAARKSAQERRRRANEAAAAVEAARETAQREAIEAEAVKLAEDAVAYQRDRALVRRQVLDTTRKAFERLQESLDGMETVKLDRDGRPETTVVERTDREGRPRNVTIPDVRGAFPAKTIESLAKVAASTLQNLRLEEGKATEIHGGGTSPADVLGETGVDDLLRYAEAKLPREGSS